MELSHFSSPCAQYSMLQTEVEPMEELSEGLPRASSEHAVPCSSRDHHHELQDFKQRSWRGLESQMGRNELHLREFFES